MWPGKKSDPRTQSQDTRSCYRDESLSRYVRTASAISRKALDKHEWKL